MRLRYIDAAKGYLMLLVILGHVLIVMNPDYSNLWYTVPQAFLYTFHMPAFFLLHGLVFPTEKWRSQPAWSFVVHRLRTLIVPYCFFELIGIFWRKALFQQSFSRGIYHMVTVRCNVGADWFLVALFMGSLLFLIYLKHPHRIYGILSVLVAFLLPMGMSGNQVLIVLGRGLLAYAFLMTGYLLKPLFLTRETQNPVCLLVSLGVTALVALIGLKFGGNDFYSCLVRNPLTLCVGGISGGILVIGFSRILQGRIVSDIIGRHTLPIMGTHQLAIYLFTYLFPMLRKGSPIHGMLLVLAIAAFELPVVWLIEHYLGFFLGKAVVRK